VKAGGVHHLLVRTPQLVKSLPISPASEGDELRDFSHTGCFESIRLLELPSVSFTSSWVTGASSSCRFPERVMAPPMAWTSRSPAAKFSVIVGVNAFWGSTHRGEHMHSAHPFTMVGSVASRRCPKDLPQSFPGLVQLRLRISDSMSQDLAISSCRYSCTW
jgi:hypothetical protein